MKVGILDIIYILRSGEQFICTYNGLASQLAPQQLQHYVTELIIQHHHRDDTILGPVTVEDSSWFQHSSFTELGKKHTDSLQTFHFDSIKCNINNFFSLTIKIFQRGRILTANFLFSFCVYFAALDNWITTRHS